MDDIYNSNQKLIYACDDLRALQAMVSMAEDHGSERDKEVAESQWKEGR